MKIKLQLSVGQEMVKEDTIEIADHKVQDLTEDELEAAIEIQIRNWADRNIHIAWEIVQFPEK